MTCKAENKGMVAKAAFRPNAKKAIFVLPLFVFLLGWACSALGNFASKQPPLVSFDVGQKKKGQRNFGSGDTCRETPCVIGKFGAIRFSDTARNNHNVELGFFHNGQYSSLALFQEASNLDKKFGERFFNKKQNRKIFNLETALSNSITDTVYVYGIRLHYELDEGDVIVVKLVDRKDAKKSLSYYFRHHKSGPVWDADVALISPLKFFVPNPDDRIRSAAISVALSTSVCWYLDPNKKHGFGSKLLHSVKINFFGGLLKRYETELIANDRVVDSNFDGFVGGGFTFVDFFVGGFGLNLARSPHSFFPFVGIEVKHMYDFLRSLKTSTKKKWQNYLGAQVTSAGSNSQSP